MIYHKGWALPDYEKHFTGYLQNYPVNNYQDTILQKAMSMSKLGVAVDLGANIGLHSVRLARVFSEVHAVEPVPSNFECLVENTKHMGNVITHCCGVSDKIETLNISLPRTIPNSGAWSVVDFEGKTNLDTVSSKFFPLDSLLHDTSMDINLIKIDVQSYETQVLKGSIEILNRCSPVILIEMCYFTEEIVEFLTNAKYILHTRMGKDGIWIKPE